MATNNSNPLQQYGYDQQTGKALADSLGISTDALAAAFAQTPLTGGGPSNQSKFMGGSSNATDVQPPGRDLTQTVNQLRIAQAAGMGGGSAGQAGQTSLPTGAVDYSGARAAENLGAQALGAAGFSGAQGAFPIYNPVPGQINSPKGGIQTNVPSPMVANAIPTGATPNVASVLGQPSQTGQGLQYWQQQAGGGSAADAAAIEKAQGLAPGTIGKQFYQAGVQQGAITPTNVTPTAGGTPTPVRPPNAVGALSAPTPWATAPAAPGIQVPSIPGHVHTAALEDAGKAIFAHFGGDPGTATPTDINNFHLQLKDMLGAQTGSTPFGAAPAGAANYTAGIPSGISAAGPPTAGPPAAPTKMWSGGMVPGRGNQDTVPALLTPGEYVIPKQQAQQIFGGRTPVRMQDGGEVPEVPADAESSDTPEVRHRKLVVAAIKSAQQAATSGATGTNQQASSTAPAAPGGDNNSWIQQAAMAQARQTMGQNAALSANTPAYPSATTPAAQGYAADANAGLVGGSAPSAATVSGAAAMTPGQTQGSIAQANMGPAMIGGVASSLGQGLAQAAKTYADSVKAWTVQPDATEKFGRNVVPDQPAAQFTQQQVDQQRKQRIAQSGYDLNLT
jgi:hypothetical protein